MSATWAQLQNRGNISESGEEEVTQPTHSLPKTSLLRAVLTTFRSKRELQRMEGHLQTHTSPSHASQPSLPLFPDIIDPRPVPEARAFSEPATPAPPTRPEDLPLSENSSSIPPTHPTLAEISALHSPSTNEVQHLNWSVPSAAVSATPVTRTLDAIELSVNEIQGLFNG
jgi:hypothetical protein